MKERSIVGEPINFAGMIYGPMNSAGVRFLFDRLFDESEYRLEEVRDGFPEYVARKRTTAGWERVFIGFGYCSSEFSDSPEELGNCDILVVWRHDWKTCPVDVICLADKSPLPDEPVKARDEKTGGQPETVVEAGVPPATPETPEGGDRVRRDIMNDFESLVREMDKKIKELTNSETGSGNAP